MFLEKLNEGIEENDMSFFKRAIVFDYKSNKNLSEKYIYYVNRLGNILSEESKTYLRIYTNAEISRSLFSNFKTTLDNTYYVALSHNKRSKYFNLLAIVADTFPDMLYTSIGLKSKKFVHCFKAKSEGFSIGNIEYVEYEKKIQETAMERFLSNPSKIGSVKKMFLEGCSMKSIQKKHRLSPNTLLDILEIVFNETYEEAKLIRDSSMGSGSKVRKLKALSDEDFANLYLNTYNSNSTEMAKAFNTSSMSVIRRKKKLNLK